MAKVTAYREGLMKKDVLGFVLRYTMAFPVLAGIGVVPIKPGAILQRVRCRHDFQYTTIVYARRPPILGQPLRYGRL
jgi:hypothetical protein